MGVWGGELRYPCIYPWPKKNMQLNAKGDDEVLFKRNPTHML